MNVVVDAAVRKLRHAVTVAGLNYEIWWLYKTRDTSPDYSDTLNRYPSFFKTSLHAHFVALIVDLCRLYETGHDSMNIPTTLELLRHDDSFDKAVLADLTARWAAARPLWTKVWVLRNEVLGNQASTWNDEEALALANLTPTLLRELWVRTTELLDVMSRALDGNAPPFDLGSKDDLTRLLQELHNAAPEK